MTGFEPATPRPPGVCATGLRHIPMMCWEGKSKEKKGLAQSLFKKIVDQTHL